MSYETLFSTLLGDLMKESEFRKVVNQNTLVQHLMRLMGEEIYGGLSTKKSLKKRKK